MQHDSSGSLLADLSGLSALQACFQSGRDGFAALEFFCTGLPPGCNFLLAAGLEPVLEYLQGLHFNEADREWLGSTGLFHASFLAALADLRFTGNVYAVPEGTVMFANEPLLRIVAPLPEAQFVESRVMDLLRFSSLCASDAARYMLAAGRKKLTDAGMTGAPGAQAALHQARARHLAGFGATTTALAAKRYDIPLAGTMTRTFVQAHEQEDDAFLSAAESSRTGATLLIDTYDTAAAARRVVALARWFESRQPRRIESVLLHHGDLLAESHKVRDILDSGGCRGIKIIAGGDFSARQVQQLVQSGAPVDRFDVSAYPENSTIAGRSAWSSQLVEYAGQAPRKIAYGGDYGPGCKQIWRQSDDADVMRHDQLALQGEAAPGTPLLEMVMHHGAPLLPNPPLSLIQAHVRQQLLALPGALRSLADDAPYDVKVSGLLQSFAAQSAQRWREQAQQDPIQRLRANQAGTTRNVYG